MMSPEQRLDTIEDELETTKKLLLSAASYAESANQGLDQLTRRVDRVASSVDQLTAAQAQTQAQLNQMSSRVEDLTTAQAQTQAQLNQMSSRVDEFVFQVQRLITLQGERLIRVDGQTERLEAIVKLLDRNYTSQQSQLQEFQLTTGAALERIDRILDYLLRQQNQE